MRSMAGPDQHRHRLDSLTGLRALAALAVFGRHVSTWFTGTALAPIGDRLLAQGANGVSFFFVLSGFVLAWSARSAPQHGAVAGWSVRRAARIVPLHVLTWALAFGVIAVEGSRVSAPAVVANLFLVHAFVPKQSVYYSMDAVSWSLSCELFFYALFWPARRTLRSLPSRLLPAALALCLLGTVGLLAAVDRVGPAHAAWYGYVAPPFRLLEFLAGMVTAELVATGRWPRVPLPVAMALAGGAYVATGWVGFPFKATGVTLVPFIVLIAAAARTDLAGEGSWWSRCTAQRLGEWSFAFYLVHQLVVRLADRGGLATAGSAAEAVLAVAAVLAVSVAASAAAFAFVERPAARWLRTRLAPGAASAAP
jgi:peptidoglycan/LPS O-acetylase OafA/YrhL